MRKEVVVFLVTLVVLAGLWFLSTSAGPGSGRGRGARGPDAVAPVPAKATPGRFVPETEVTWAADASNIFETPTETRDLPPLDLAPPAFPRLFHPGPPLPVTIGLKARSGLRRPIVPSASPAPAPEATNGGGGGTEAPAGAGTSTAPSPAPAASEPLIPLGKDLGAIERIKLSLEAELKREQELRLAQESEEDRKRRLDKLVLTDQTVIYGEMAAGKNENRYAIKRELDRIRTDPSLTEPDRNEKLKKFNVLFKEDRKGKLGRASTWTGERVAHVTFSDTPENRYRMRLLEAPTKDLAQQLELAKLVFDARLFQLAVQHLTEMKKNGLSSPEMLVMLADAQHEIYQYNEELEVLRQAVKEFPDSAALLARLGRLQVKLGMLEDARASFAQALARNQNDALASSGMGDVLMRTGDAAKAIPYLRDALNLAGSDTIKVDGMRLLLAEAYLRTGDFRNAHEMVDLVIGRSNVGPEHAPVLERAFALAAMAALGQGQLVEARTRAEEGAKRYPLSGQLSYLLGVVMAQQGELDSARSKLTTAIELDPLLTGHAQVALAMLDEAAARDDAAVASAESGALVANPAAMQLRLPLGRALLHVGDLAKARKQLLAALDYEPRSADALAALGDAAYAEGAFHDAVRFYDRAAALEPAFPQLLPRRIVTQVRRRKLAEAEELAAKVGTADLKDPFVQAALAYFQYSKGNHAEALNALQKLGESEEATALASYGSEAHAAITAHQNKEMWTDTFTRTGAQIGRQWKREIGAGITPALQGQAIGFDGTQRGTNVVSDKPTMIWQERQGDRVFGFSADLDLPAQPGVYAGVGLMVFNQGKAVEKWPGYPERDGALIPYTGMQVALSPDAKLVYRVLVRGKMTEWEPVPVTTYAGGPVTIELRLADPKEGVIEVLVNRESVLRQTLSDLKKFRRQLELQIFCQAQIDRKVHFLADNVVIVTLKEPK